MRKTTLCAFRKKHNLFYEGCVIAPNTPPQLCPDGNIQINGQQPNCDVIIFHYHPQALALGNLYKP